eukprot:gb/GFBE01049601.1/.p1 GENE.gb/GFBE01049601.1/~~gb/GFBE01049601.1/.p1  ORF type:complete len:408 (+),score=51.17 gb/GFBE01049601.1/:1-1224(+)
MAFLSLLLLLPCGAALLADEASGDCAPERPAAEGEDVAEMRFLQERYALSSARATSRSSRKCTGGLTPGRHLIQLPKIQRQFQLIVPPELAEKPNGVPLVMSFHGLAESPWYNDLFIGFSDLVTRYGWLGVLPYGWYTNETDGQDNWHACCSSLCNSTECCEKAQFLSPEGEQCRWTNEVDYFSATVDSFSTTEDMVKGIVEWAEEHTCVDSDKIFGMGWSLGGYVMNHMACRDWSPFKAVAPMGFDTPMMEPGCSNSKPFSYAGFCSTSDEARSCTPDRVVKSAEFWSKRLNCVGKGPGGGPVSYNRSATSYCTEWSTCDDGNFVEYCITVGIDHTPSGQQRPDSTTILRPASDLEWPEYIFQKFSLLVGESILHWGHPDLQDMLLKKSVFPPPKRHDHAYMRRFQ